MEADDPVTGTRLREQFKFCLGRPQGNWTPSLGFTLLVLETNDLIYMEFTEKSLSQPKPNKT